MGACWCVYIHRAKKCRRKYTLPGTYIFAEKEFAYRRLLEHARINPDWKVFGLLSLQVQYKPNTREWLKEGRPASEGRRAKILTRHYFTYEELLPDIVEYVLSGAAPSRPLFGVSYR